MNQSELNAIENEAVLRMSPDELLRYSQAEEDAQEAARDEAKLLETATGRQALTDYQDTPSDDEAASIGQLPTELRATARGMYPEELQQLMQGRERSKQALAIMLQIYDAVAARESEHDQPSE